MASQSSRADSIPGRTRAAHSVAAESGDVSELRYEFLRATITVCTEIGLDSADEPDASSAATAKV